MDQKVGNETQMLEIKTNSTCYNFFLLSTAYLQLVAVNLSDHLCYHQMYMSPHSDSPSTSSTSLCVPSSRTPNNCLKPSATPNHDACR